MEHLEHVDTFTAGTVGRPGRREFFLQVRTGADRINIKCEKQQAAALGQYLRRLLNDLPEPADRPLNGAMQMTPPDDVAFVLGPIGLAYEPERDRFVVQLEEIVIREEDEPEPEPGDPDRPGLRVFLSRSQAAAYADHAEEVVAAGRPTCMWCSGPIDPDGHPCPRMN